MAGGLAAAGLAAAGIAYDHSTRVDLAAPAIHGLHLCQAPPAGWAGRPRLVVLGDSLVRGNMGHNWLADVRQTLETANFNWLVVNGGINGARTGDLAEEVDRIAGCQPDRIAILIGTNDVVFRNLTPGTQDWYETAYGLLLLRLQSMTDADIAVFTLPLIGEDEGSALNRRAETYSVRIREMAGVQGLALLDLREAHLALLTDGNSAPPPCETPTDVITAMEAVRPKVSRTQRVDFDDLAMARGHTLVIDCIHLSRRGARPAADLLIDWLTAPEP